MCVRVELGGVGGGGGERGEGERERDTLSMSECCDSDSVHVCC